jgi:hypothetical protein
VDRRWEDDGQWLSEGDGDGRRMCRRSKEELQAD